MKTSRSPFLSTPWHSAGETIPGLKIYGEVADYKVVNERAIRAAAGIMLVTAATALAFARLHGNYLPLQIITVFFVFDFLAKIFTGLTPISPTGMIGSFLVRHQKPEWTSVRQKRFSWSIGMVVAMTVAILSNLGYKNNLTTSLCMLCIVLMWLEATAGYCLGCHIYRLLIKAKLVNPHDYPPQACPGGACQLSSGRLDETSH